MARSYTTYVHKPVELKTDMVPSRVDKEEFGRRLEKLMLARGWSQAELGRRAGLHRALVSAYIGARNYPSPQNLLSLAKAFGISPEELLPNYAANAAERSTAPGFSVVEVAGSPDMMWLQVNQMVTMEQALEIGNLLKRAKAADGK